MIRRVHSFREGGWRIYRGKSSPLTFVSNRFQRLEQEEQKDYLFHAKVKKHQKLMSKNGMKEVCFYVCKNAPLTLN